MAGSVRGFRWLVSLVPEIAWYNVTGESGWRVNVAGGLNVGPLISLLTLLDRTGERGVIQSGLTFLMAILWFWAFQGACGWLEGALVQSI